MVYTRDDIVLKIAQVSIKHKVNLDIIPAHYLQIMIEGATIADFATIELFDLFVLKGLEKGIENGAREGLAMRVVKSEDCFVPRNDS